MKVKLKFSFRRVSTRLRSVHTGIFCLMAFIFHCNIAVGQDGFNKTYDTGRSLWLKDIEWHDKTGLVVSGEYYNDSSNFQNLIIFKIDTTGEILNLTEISDSLGNSHLAIREESKFIVNDSGQTVLPFVYYNRNSLGLTFVEETGNLRSVYEYPIDTDNAIIPFDILQINDGYLISGAYSRPPLYKIEAFVMKINSLGTLQWIQFHGSANYHEFSRNINQINSNLYILSGVQFNDVPPKFERGWAVFIDSLGYAKSEWIADTNDFHEHGLLSLQYDITTKELEYFTYADRQTYYPGEDYTVTIPLLVVRDSSMNLIAFNEYGPYAVNHYITALIKSMNGGWLGAGRTTLTTDEYSSPVASSRGRVVKIEDNLDLAWSVTDTAFFHSEYGSRCYISGLTESPSQSIYAVGGARKYIDSGYKRSYGWILKISPDGCIDTLCTSVSVIDKLAGDANHFNLFPNPSSGLVTIAYNGLIAESTFLLYDSYGRLVYKLELDELTNAIDLSDFGQGYYFWQVISADQQYKFAGKLIIN